MAILVVGSVALDSVKTPFGERKDALGGSATFFSYSASFFHPVNLVGVVGEDFPREHIELLNGRSINTEGLRIIPGGETFRWDGYYDYDLNEAHTLSTCLNVFETFQPELPESYRDSEYVFLANIDPELQIHVLEQVRGPKLRVCDTMNFWIEGKRDKLIELLGKVDIITLNDGEARQLTEDPNLVKAAQKIISWGPKYVVIKKGEHGALLFSEESVFSAPALPLEEIYDPTGAGDTFAGGFVGYLAREGTLDAATLRRAMIYGSVMASFNVEDFSLERLKRLKAGEIETRYKQFVELVKFE